MAVTVTTVDNRASTTNPFVASITQDSVRNVTDVVYFLTYYGDEATNPVFTANPSFVPANPGYAVTQYFYSAPGVLSQVVAYTAVGGKGQVFTGV